MLVYFLLAVCSAHVRMFFSDSQFTLERPLRNAPSAVADGEFSVSGPCGGVTQWGGPTGDHTSFVPLGGNVTLKINYNGGHKSPDNEFSVRFRCGTEGNGPSEADMGDADTLDASQCRVLRCPVSGQYPCGAPDGNDFTPGYMFQCDIPTESAGGDCTFSVLDQRNWGGCIDVSVGRELDGRTYYGLNDHIGPYIYDNSGVFTNTPLYPNCCCTMTLGDQFEVTAASNGDDALLSGYFNMTCPDADIMTANGMSDFEAAFDDLLLSTDDGFIWRGNYIMPNGQTLEFSLADRNLYYTNIDSAEPMICDGMIRVNDYQSGQSTNSESCPTGSVDATGNFVTSESNGEDTSGSGAKVGAFPFIIIIVFILTSAAIYKFTRESGEEKMTKEQVIANV